MDNETSKREIADSFELNTVAALSRRRVESDAHNYRYWCNFAKLIRESKKQVRYPEQSASIGVVERRMPLGKLYHIEKKVAHSTSRLREQAKAIR